MSKSPTQASAPLLTLPQLPHPSSLSLASSSAITETKKKLSDLALLRDSILADQASYVVNPPQAGSLPPLPPIPIPPVNHTRRSSLLTQPPTSNTPVVRPPLPSISPFKGSHTLSECIEAVRKSGHVAEERYKGTAVWMVIDNSIAAWILLKQQEEEGGVPLLRSLRLYNDSIEDKPIHAQSSSAPLRALSKHLSELSLTLPELCFRLISLPMLLKQPCHYCHKHLKVPDGLPYGRTGYMSGLYGEDEGEEGSEGRWVNWHPSCEPSA